MDDKEEVKAIPARVAAALKGAIVADAATMGTHWIYDLEELKGTVASMDAPEFKDPPFPKFYSAEEFPGHYGPGMLSPTGEQLLFFAEYCGKHKCVTAGHLSVQFKQWAETWGGRKDHATQEFLKCMKAADRSVELIGEEDKEGTYLYAFWRICQLMTLSSVMAWIASQRISHVYFFFFFFVTLLLPPPPCHHHFTPIQNVLHCRIFCSSFHGQTYPCRLLVRW